MAATAPSMAGRRKRHGLHKNFAKTRVRSKFLLIEAKRNGIHSFCITIDRDARAYLPHMDGAAHYVIVNNVRMPLLKVADIYRRLTS